MLLLTGPAGPGKTSFLLDRFRAALESHDPGVRLLVPTATMVQHFQNRMAREGFVFRPQLVGTLSRFVEEWTAGISQVSEPGLYLIVEEAILKVNRPEFASVARMPGFCASLARGIEEFHSAGCDAARLARNLPDTPLALPFLRVFEEVDRELERRLFTTRAARLDHAARRISAEGLGGVHTVLMDGFQALPDPELALIRAIASRAEIMLTLPEAEERLAAMGFTARACEAPREPAVQVCEAASVEREADEIARRILEQFSAGRRFRDMAIVVRNPAAYEALLRATLERFGIPARFYFDVKASEHATVRRLCGIVDAMLGGWDYEATLAAVRLSGLLATDRFDFAVRERMPGAGLQGLRALADHEGITRLLDSFEGLEAWRTGTRKARDWAARALTLRVICGGQRAALDLFDAALDEAARAIAPEQEIAFPEFWRVAKSVLRLTPLRLDDQRRNVVHVLGAHEARQWSLPVVFVCGLVEKSFPQSVRQEPFFPDEARRELNVRGIRIRTAAEFEADERRLFNSAVGCATSLAVLSYPRFDGRGEPALRSIFLDDVLTEPYSPPPVKPRPKRPRGPERALAAIRDNELLAHISRHTAVLSPSRLETYLQCPFQFFARHLLRLQEPPKRPEDRLDFMLQGNIVHEVLAELYREPQPLEPLFERVFRRRCEEACVVAGYRAEAARQRMREDLLAFTADKRWPPAGEVRTEQEFLFALSESLEINGRIDRIDVRGGRAFVIDYKYSGAQGTKDRARNENLLQAPLYLLAAERCFGLEPAAMFYLGLKGGVQYSGWSNEDIGLASQPFTREWLDNAVERSRAAAEEIRKGIIESRPAGLQACRYCACRDVCRWEGAEAESAAVEGA